jgi:DUF971 family protein
MKPHGTDITPTAIHLRKAESLDITWSDGRSDSFPLPYLRKHCPCAGCKGEKDLFGRTLMPILKTTYDGPITATAGEPVGNYAIRISFSDGHDSGIFSYVYLQELAARLADENR